MPVLHEYTNSFGYYIRGNIGGEFITYQITSAGEEILEKSNYKSGSTLSWALCQRLAEREYIYTYGTKSPSTSLPENELELTAEEEAMISSTENSSTSDKRNSDEAEIEIPDEILPFLNKWGQETKTSKRLLEVLNDESSPSKWFASIRGFGEVNTHSEVRIQDDGIVYYFDEPRNWQVKDLRPMSFDNDFVVSIRDDECPNHRIRIKAGGLDQWRLDTKNPSDKDVVIFSNIISYVFDLLSELPDYQLDAGNWHFQDGKRIKLTRSQTAAIGNVLQNLAEKYGLQEGRETGVVSSKGYAGYGRILVEDIGATVPFTSRDVVDGPIRTDERVQFQLRLVKHTYRAENIERI